MGIHSMINWLEVGERLGLMRIALGLKQNQLCNRTGIDTSSWSRFEKGQRPFLPDDAKILYDVYGVDANFIYFGREDGLPSHIVEEIRRLRAKN